MSTSLTSQLFFKDFYFENIKLFWPYNLYKYREDLALTYLMRNGYDVELALALIGKFYKIGKYVLNDNYTE